MEYIDITGGPDLANRIFKRMVTAVIEEGGRENGGEGVPSAAIKTALILVVDSFCRSIDMSHEEFARALVEHKDKR